MFTRTLLVASLTFAVHVSSASGQKIYWTDSGTGKIQRADLDGSNIEDLVTTGLTEPSGIALDLTAGRVYWADSGAGKIQRADLDGSNIEDLVSGLGSPFGIALDRDAGTMYWTDAGQPGGSDGKIQRANLDGSNIEDLVTTGLVDPRGIALDPGSGKMYWADTEAHRIQRANLDGTGVEEVVGGNTLLYPSQVVLDLGAEKLYWTGFVLKDGVIARANLDGSNLEFLISTGTGAGGPATDGIALDAAAGKMYWTQWDSRIRRADLMNGFNREDLVTGLEPVGLALDLRESIPTVSTWGMVILILLLLTAGTILLIRRRSVTLCVRSRCPWAACM